MPVQQPAHLSFLVLLAIALALIGGGCATWEHEIFEEEFDESYQPATFKILTYNIWHGLHVGGIVNLSQSGLIFPSDQQPEC
jgi:hypothetical protein